LSDLTTSLAKDIQFRLPDNYQRGAGDTYFSGKMLARLARILLVLEEVQEICADTLESPIYESCSDTAVPGSAETEAALVSLRTAIDVWLGKDAEAPFVYDTAWRGVASCGCLYDGAGCSNRYPDCPAFTDPGLNFGNGFWNDSHFHYGYFIYACSVLAHFDPSWGISRFERVLLLVRNIANPSHDDRFFPLYRHFDPFQGHSWAGGITLPIPPNGRNQESSSEAIAAYEAVALFGHTMSIIPDLGDEERERANSVASTGSVLLAMELRSAKRYWHVKHEDYPADLYQAYDHAVVGIMWQTMFQFQTWFGSAPYLVNGIQMLPLTPIAGDRDDDGDWTRNVYSDLVSSCDDGCVSAGWSIQQIATLGILGYQEEAFISAKNLPQAVFDTPGGNGHSLSNTLWFIASRPDVADPESLSTGAPAASPDQHTPITCGSSSTCAPVLDNVADGYSCADRIKWLMNSNALSEQDACSQVADEEFPDECGGCTFQSSPTNDMAAPEETTMP
jgi:endo-1,3(4)-beta-glucanase